MFASRTLVRPRETVLSASIAGPPKVLMLTFTTYGDEAPVTGGESALLATGYCSDDNSRTVKRPGAGVPIGELACKTSTVMCDVLSNTSDCARFDPAVTVTCSKCASLVAV